MTIRYNFWTTDAAPVQLLTLSPRPQERRHSTSVEPDYANWGKQDLLAATVRVGRVRWGAMRWLQSATTQLDATKILHTGLLRLEHPQPYILKYNVYHCFSSISNLLLKGVRWTNQLAWRGSPDCFVEIWEVCSICDTFQKAENANEKYHTPVLSV